MIDPLVKILHAATTTNRDYAELLVRDLSDDQMLGQPVSGRRLNHPAWILCHLNVYASVALCMLKRDLVADPKDHQYGMKSEVLDDPDAYPPRGALVQEFLLHHDEVIGALERVDPSLLSEETPVERWRPRAATVGEMLAYLLIRHESLHLGQLSAWRRAMGLPRV